MTALGTAQIRRAFLDHFARHGHQEVGSSSLVPAHDPSLLFTNAGMVQFKDVFTGKETRAYVRATTAQKCVRAGGKHNDLENVGFTPRHHTFFEMLGNFSFGDYFKEEAIRLAWSLVVDGFGIDAERLCVTVFRGEDGIPADNEAEELWRAVGVPAERIFRLGKSDNYWQMGDTGPQGPCSELHYLMDGDPREALSAERVAASAGWMEIWNLVFMQFERAEAGGPLVPLPKPSIDTGAGLERLAVVLQGQRSNYEIDLFAGLIERIAEAAKRPYGGSAEPDDVSMRVIADHARATAFLVADGVQPSNEGRGYVLRRIMRRAIRHGERMGFDGPFFASACLDVIGAMGEAYPELTLHRSLIEKVAESEEVSFRQTLGRGLRLLEQRFDTGAPLDPGFVATLYDTYGFPIDLTRVIAEERGLSVDEDAALAEVRAKQAGGGGKLSGEAGIDRAWFQLRERVGATRFVGYEGTSGSVGVLAALVDGQAVEQVGPGTEALVLFDATPFYGESGGQVGDTGTLTWPDGEAKVLDTIRPLSELHVHRVEVVSGTLRVGATLDARVDEERLAAVRRNHSATHLLHLSLREVLGDHVTQKGSLVAPDRLRFDYAHFEPLTDAQIERIERRVNERVLADAPTEAQVQSLDAARAEGAMMLFGEKYGAEVRVVRIGGVSVELCGGQHVGRSGEIGLFKIVSDGSLAAGVRRVEAVTGLVALEWAQTQARLLREAASALRTAPEELPGRVEKLGRRVKQLEREVEEAKAEAALGGRREGGEIEDIGGLRVLVQQADGTPKKALRPLADKLRDRLGSGVVVVAACEEGKAAVLVAATKDLAGKVHAGEVVRAASEAMGGSGGGRPDFAQGGGPAEALPAGLAAARAALARGPILGSAPRTE